MNNKVALITGSSRGIGRATITEFAKKGYNVVINYKNSEKEATELKEQLQNDYNIKALAIRADVSNEEEVKEMVNIIISEFGHIDVLVNNAGIAIDKDFEERTVDDWQKTLNTNLIGPFVVSKCVGEVMLNQKKGKIINISSTNGINSFFPTSIDYDASKAGVINLTHNLAIQYAPYINVNCVAPGWVNTEMNKELPKELIEEETEKIYKKRFAEPSEIGKVVCFLASDDADFINDEVIKIDGGY
ncbi:MAG: 3-oxoacyl-ACP reductase FabG [Bacilli bacterium]|nr:3-oxoacyl-ACP reductase FabG [Bacilli bacterium]